MPAAASPCARAVAEIGRVRREDAVAEQAEHGLVLLLQQQLELCLVLVQVVEVAHNRQCSRALRASKVPRPGTSRPGATSRSGSRTKARSCRRGSGDLQVFLVDLGISEEQEVEVERPRALSRSRRAVPAVTGLDDEQQVEELAGRQQISRTATPFRKRGWSRYPTGSVSSSVDTARSSTPGVAASSARAERIVSSRSPRFAPSPM